MEKITATEVGKASPFQYAYMPALKGLKSSEYDSFLIDETRSYSAYRAMKDYQEHMWKVFGVNVDMIPEILRTVLSNKRLLAPSLADRIDETLKEYGYGTPKRCSTCRHFKDDGCYIKGYKQAKKRIDYCSSHESITF